MTSGTQKTTVGAEPGAVEETEEAESAACVTIPPNTAVVNSMLSTMSKDKALLNVFFIDSTSEKSSY
jgi:hypothetical protein